MLISELYKRGVESLKEKGISDPELEVSLLLAHILQKSRTHIYLYGSDAVSETKKVKFENLLSSRLERIPLAYLIGAQEFWSLPFKVSPDVLIPRPETEQMLEIIFSITQNSTFKINKVLDFGTGSGAIAVVLAKEIEQASVVAVDRSIGALNIARQNIDTHKLSNRVHCLCSNWGTAIGSTKWDLIVSNPPYINSEVMAALEPEVQQEPEMALDGGAHGMEAIYDLVSQLERLLRINGWFFMEIGYDQEKYVLDLFDSLSCFGNVCVHKDHAGQPRVLQARKLK